MEDANEGKNNHPINSIIVERLKKKGARHCDTICMRSTFVVEKNN